MLLFTIGAAFVHALTPAFAKLTLEAGPRSYGLVFAAMGSGAIIAVWILRRLRDRFSPRMLLTLTMTVFTVAAAASASAARLEMVVVLFVFVGIGWTGTFSPMSALLQLWSPSHLKGRIIALYWGLHFAVYALLAYVAGRVAESLSVRFALIVGAAFAGIAALVTSRLALPTGYAGPQREIAVGPSTR
jgi:MFS family permease